MAGRRREPPAESYVEGFELRRADKSILITLDRGGPEYPAIVASRAGLHVPYVQRRCEALAAVGYIERVTDEVLYRITDEGRSVVR